MERRDFGILFKHIHDALYKKANNRLRKMGLTLSQAGLLTELARQPQGEATMKELEHTLQVAQPTAAGLVVRLEGKGFLRSRGDARDRRIKIVALTEQGRDICCQARIYMEDDEARLLLGFSAEEKEQFYRFLLRAAENMAGSQNS